MATKKTKTDVLYKKVTKDDTLWLDEYNGMLKRGSKIISNQESEIIKSQAKVLSQNIAWKQIIIDTRYDIQRLLIEESNDIEDLRFYRAALFTLKLIEDKTINLSNVTTRAPGFTSSLK